MPGSREGPVRTLVVRTPAKLNLGLEVLGRREDGYHDLRTIFQAIDLEDELEFRATADRELELRVGGPETVPGGPENLVLRAGRRLRDHLGLDRGAEIRLTKNIPAGTGLGGGSSDAAATFLGLAALWGAEVPRDSLLGLALEVGSDVPFFLAGGTARGEGRGEILTPLPPPPEAGWLLAVPPFRISTEKAYRALPQRLTPPDPKTTMLETALRRGSFEGFVENIANDLEVGVVRMQPRLARIKQELLDRGAAGVGLTGSGSALFAVFRSRGEAARLLEEDFRPGGASLVGCSPVDHGARVISRDGRAT